MASIHSSAHHRHHQGHKAVFTAEVTPVTSEIPECSGLGPACGQSQIQSEILEPMQMTSQHKDILYLILAIGLLQDYHFLKWILDLEVSFPPHLKDLEISSVLASLA